MAKKVLIILCAFFLLSEILLCGCEKKEESKELVTDFSASFSAEYRKEEVKGTLSTNRQGITNINITYPESISGLSINYRSSEMQVARESLICSADEAYIPANSFPSLLKSVLNGIGEGRAKLYAQNEAGCTYNLKTESGNCEISVDKDGKITGAKINSADFSIEFSDIKTVQN